ncbi:MAG: hybrid sensor histidine kinase/response regulator [Granulosicoccus sp.]
MNSLPDEIVEIRSQALLEALHRRTLRDGLPMVIVILVIGALSVNETNIPLVIVWVLCGLIVQATRYHVIPQLNCKDKPGAKKRLDVAVCLAYASGLVQASSIMFFPSLDDASRSIYTMIIFGVCTGHIVGSHGHPPTFIGFAVPQLVSVSIAWAYHPLDGLTIWEHANVLLIGVLGIFLFVSSRDVFKAFQDNCELTEKLKEALDSETNANAAKTRFLASASHDLRQPLHTMSMLSAALTLRPLDNESAAIANRISEAMGELSAELDSLLDISKMDAGATRITISRFPVNPLVERLVRDYLPAANAKKLKLSGIYNTDLTLLTDRILLDRTIRNLVDNAVKYTDSGSITVKVSEQDSRCVIQVEDTGVGIPDTEHKRVFEEFYQLHNPERDRKNGLGLGLSIVGRIANLLDAKMHLVSTPGVGSTFSVSIAKMASTDSVECKRSEIHMPVNVGDAPEQTFAGIHTLIVDDNREVRRGMQTLLETAGSRVSEASGTPQAVEIAKVDVPDILLLDMRLPDGDSGYKTISALRALVPDIPTIIISGELVSNDAEYVDIDNCEYFLKPVDMVTLFAKMQNMLEPRA